MEIPRPIVLPVPLQYLAAAKLCGRNAKLASTLSAASVFPPSSLCILPATSSWFAAAIAIDSMASPDLLGSDSSLLQSNNTLSLPPSPLSYWSGYKPVINLIATFFLERKDNLLVHSYLSPKACSQCYPGSMLGDLRTEDFPHIRRRKITQNMFRMFLKYRSSTLKLQ
ncbi:uncharacterized protein BDR25DRAFT_356154 [Lindgomyces ingoldianus]|uniref:Uncharacterized protein n=1 Tax=Lindgomyces ingoldianus TaxID=673940 RepID=A0ACB6QSL0_9PLEO|nr:uncharacterized protein BDR25DRAFT_356154 [Lindgomyces ingoldianus]KAF2469886.1 hypothetical protein BDR25DRAFT_356154 [Lindgomyces ingoldianus]